MSFVDTDRQRNRELFRQMSLKEKWSHIWMYYKAAFLLGAILLGVGRGAGSEFSFFMAIPTMLGASAIKLLGFLTSGAAFGFQELTILLVGTVVSFLVSMVAIKALMNYVRKHSFAAFGFYRIGLGILVLVVFAIKAILA